MDDLELEIQAILKRYFGKCAKDIDIDNATEEILEAMEDEEYSDD